MKAVGEESARLRVALARATASLTSVDDIRDFSIPHVPLCFNTVIGTLGRCNGNAVVLSHKDDVN